MGLILSPILILVAIPLYLTRLGTSVLGKCCGSGLGRMVPTRSAMFASDEIYTQPLMTNVARFVFDGTLELRTIEKLIDQNWVQARSTSGNLKYPELKQYVTVWLGYFFWKNDEDFNIKNHVKLYFNQKPGNFISDMEVNDAWNEMSMKPFDRDRSPWEVILIPFYRQNRHKGDESSKSVLIFRWHHALSDGFSILNLLSCIADLNMSSVARMGRKQNVSCCSGIGKSFKLFFTAPWVILTLITARKDRNPWHLEENKMTRYWHLGVGPSIPIQIVHELKTNYSVSFACVLLAAVTGSMRKLMVKGFEMNSLKPVPWTISCGVPFPLPDHPDKLRNHWAICTVQLPVGEANPVSRLQIIDRNLKEMKRSSKPIIAYMIAPWIGGLPACCINALVTNHITTVVSSIMPGPPEPLTNFLGHTARDASYIIGCGPGRNGFSFSVLSYNGTVKFALTVDSAFSPDEKIAQDLITFVEEELNFLRQICVQHVEDV
ncbi:unnamed protein product [Allacma fusca]|uniref:Diacylglycerol O-acyltransferase n=1 Tax=Allacma fusca TaxID=39272 RepID=A0A8J2L1G1_9HEXA|nr:unnamed protein product [Allacma fusca]